MTRKRDSQLIFLFWILRILVVCPDVLTWLVFDNNISVFLINTWIIMIFSEILSCCGLIFYFGSILHVVYRHERAARILAKQLCFNLRFLKNEKKSAVKVMAIVIGLFLVFSACSLRCSLIYIMKEEQPCNDKKFKLPLLVFKLCHQPSRSRSVQEGHKRGSRTMHLLCDLKEEKPH